MVLPIKHQVFLRIASAYYMRTFLLVFVTFSALGVTSKDDDFYQRITTAEFMFEVIEADAVATAFTDQGAEFTHYYSPSLKRSFIVDDELGEVCKTYRGSEILSCFPCSENQVSAHCP